MARSTRVVLVRKQDGWHRVEAVVAAAVRGKIPARPVGKRTLSGMQFPSAESLDLDELLARTKRISGITCVGEWTFWAHCGAVYAIAGVHGIAEASKIIMGQLDDEVESHVPKPRNRVDGMWVSSREIPGPSKIRFSGFEVVIRVNATGPGPGEMRNDDIARLRAVFDEVMPRFNLGNGVEGRVRAIRDLSAAKGSQ